MTTVNEATIYTVYDLEGASNVMREIVAIAKQQAELDALKDAEIARINAWHEKASKPLISDREWRESQLINYHQNVLAENPKQKSVSTPWGIIKSTTRKPSVKKPDKDILLAVLETTGQTDLIKEKVTREGDWANYKKQLTIIGENVVDENGTIIEEFAVEPENTTFKVEVSDL